MSVDCCMELKELLNKYEEADTVVDEDDFFLFSKTVHQFSRQCKCLQRNPTLIVPLENLLKKFYSFTIAYTNKLKEIKDWDQRFLLRSELLYQSICKTFQLQYPLYQAYESVKNNFEVTEEQRQSIRLFCDIVENPNASELLFENIADFCSKQGIEKITDCFKEEKKSSLPLSLASCLIGVVAQLRTWMNDKAIIDLIKPMSTPITRYLCDIPEEEFRLMTARATAEQMLNTVKVQTDHHLSYELDVLSLAFKYFMSSTLAVRLAGINLITNQIHNLIEVSARNQAAKAIDSGGGSFKAVVNHGADVDHIKYKRVVFRPLQADHYKCLCADLASWLNDHEMVEHLFGPNYHVELIKQSQFLLNFLAQEKKLQFVHIDCIWAAAQLKHISRYVLDLLISLAKTMDYPAVQYTLQQIAKLPITAHTKQTLLLASLLTRNIWAAGLEESDLVEEKGNEMGLSKKHLFLSQTSSFNSLNVSPIQSPSLSSDGSTDEEMAGIHAQRFKASEHLRSLNLKINDNPTRALANAPLLQLPPSPMDLVEQGNNDIPNDVEGTISSTNTNGSSPASEREQEIMEDLERVSPAIVATLKRNEKFLIEFDVEGLCDPGKTLLWDLLQHPTLETLHENVLDEIQKLLWQLICYSGNLKVRKVFVKGCLENIKNNRAVIISFKILPKILSVFPHSNSSTESNKLLLWAVKDLELMDRFFENLQNFITSCKLEKNSDEEHLSEHEQQIQARLDFLTAMYSYEITPDHFRLTIEQLDCLWRCLVTELPDLCHYLLLNWLLKQSNNEELHALGLDAFKYVFVNKLPELNAEKMTLTGLNLFQKLFGLTRLSNASPFEHQDTETEEYQLGTEQLWNIALKAERLSVSNETMSILNHHYLAVGDNSVLREQEFVTKCITVLDEALADLEKNCLQSLKVIQQVLKILRNHLETYSKRFAFHIELWRLNGKNMTSHQCLNKQNNKDHMLKIFCQPTGVTEKVTFKLFSSELLAVFRAQVTDWCVRLQEERDAQTTGNAESLTTLKPPFRLISHGHELTPDLDIKTLGDLGIRDQQLVYISIANMRKDRISNSSQLPASLLSPPNFDSVPMIQLLKEENFKKIFNLLDVLYKVTKLEDYQGLWLSVLEQKIDESCLSENSELYDDPNESVKPQSAEDLLNNTWELILLLPTNLVVRSKFEQFDFKVPIEWSQILNLDQKFNLLYILQVLDSISLPLTKPVSSNVNADSSGDSDSSMSDSDKSSTSRSESLLAWANKLFESGFIKHVLTLLLSEEMNPERDLDEWSLNCVAFMVKLLTRIGLVSLDNDNADDLSEKSTEKKEQKNHVFRARYRSTEVENIVVINQFNQELLDMLSQDELYKRFLSILTYVSENAAENTSLGCQDVRASVVYHCLSFLVCWVSSHGTLRESFINNKHFSSLLVQLVFFSPQRSVRNEASRGIYKLCVSGGNTVLNRVLNVLLSKLSELVSLQRGMQLVQSSSSLANYRDYFWLLCRLISKYDTSTTVDAISIRTALLQVSMFIQDAENNGPDSKSTDYCLIGLLQTCTALLQHDTSFKSSPQGFELIRNVFHECLFALPDSSVTYDDIHPRCETKSARQAAFDLLLQLVSKCKETYFELQNLFLRHHSASPGTKNHYCYGWNYWPLDQERSRVGYVGLVNLGATCYMASCVQQLFMIPEARSVILQASISKDTKYPIILKEIQKMFAYLFGSIRKAYNPRSFCKTYVMDKQLLNTGEQKDMTEFFTDFVTKMEDMGPDLKSMIRELFCGVITNNVISLDCSHVSKTEEEFFSVRCTVADMKNLYESLDEVTVKDVLEGDNKYTCSQCNDKVRAEKRACFKSLPKLMCFNTMRYTFNMVTMMKEKVNTHFSFPMKLNMAAYTEEYLLKKKGVGDPDEIPGHWYTLAGVVVHTGTAEGGHYYSFIRDRTSIENNWYLFNDAEVKTFDPMQIAAECFGGEMTTKTFDAMTEKYMDFSFEKTHSAYMLFYEHSDMEKQIRVTKDFKLPKELQQAIWEDNYQFLQDKLVFDNTYFNFIWQFCSVSPKTIGNEAVFHSAKLALSFLLETLVHSREKPHMKGWVELLMYGFEQSHSVCEWFLDYMARDDWWLQQLLVRCPAQHIRQMFGQLCLIAIRNIRPSNVQLYTRTSENEEGEEGEEEVGSCSPITRFLKTLLSMLEENLKCYCKHLSELFHFLYQFLSLGHEECTFMLRIDAISTLVNFYNALKASDLPEVSCEDEEEVELEDEEILSIFPEDKYYPSALEKMLGSIALLLEVARDGLELNLSDQDLMCFSEDKDYSFIYQITADAINLRQTANIIFHLCRYDENRAKQIVAVLMGAAQKLSVEKSQPFYKLLSLLTEVGENGLPGLPSFINIILPNIWKAAESNPALTLEWLSTQVSRNKMVHQSVLDNLKHWVVKYLIADNSPRIRGGAAFLLAALVPNNNSPQQFRGRLFSFPHKEMKMTEEAKSILHHIYFFLLRLLPSLEQCCDKSSTGTSRLVNYFTILNYCVISDEEKGMFTTFSEDLWKLYHPVMSEPDIAVHFNKQSLLTFWYNVCDDFPDNIKFITDTDEVASNLAYNYILSNDDQEVISFNNATLPVYYGLLRLACCHSINFCKALSVHANMTWAFEHLMTRASQYPQVVEELLQLIKLFVGEMYKEKEDLLFGMKFRRKAIELFCGCMDGQHSWTTLISVLKLLIESEEDCIHVACNNGLNPLGEAFSTLHIMYHEATACNVISDILQVTNILHTILECCHKMIKLPEVFKALNSWMERTDIMMKAMTLLNSFTPKDVHKSCLKLLNILLQIYPEEAIETLAPIIHQSHLAIRMNQSPGAIGPYFPKLTPHSKLSTRKSSSRSTTGQELNMALHPLLLDTTKINDDGYQRQLCEYFEGYHTFVDKFCRYGLNLEDVPDVIIEISCLLAVEVLPLKFHIFPKLWQEVWSKSPENAKYRSCIQRLFSCESFIEFVETLFSDERELFDDTVFYTFMCFYLPKVHQKVFVDKHKQDVIDQIIAQLMSDVSEIKTLSLQEFEEVFPRIHGDVRALCLMLSVTQSDDLIVSQELEDCISSLIESCDQHKVTEQESRVPPITDNEEQDEEIDENPKTSVTEVCSPYNQPDESGSDSPPTKRRKNSSKESNTESKVLNTYQDNERPGPSTETDQTCPVTRSILDSSEDSCDTSDIDFKTNTSFGDEDNSKADTSSKSSKTKNAKGFRSVAEAVKKACEVLVSLLSRRGSKENLIDKQKSVKSPLTVPKPSSSD